jgi:sugar lactone lactonase YvrE
MKLTRNYVSIGIAILTTLSATVNLSAAEILGKKPKYLLFGASSVPNEQAILKKIWAPGLDEGYVPQGITIADGVNLLASYKSTDPKQDKWPCRISNIDPVSRNYIGFFDMPEDCGHAGGLAYLGRGALVVSDTRRLYKIELDRAFRGARVDAAIQSIVKLAGELKGSFVDFDGTDLWIGSYEKEEAKAKLHRLSLKIFDESNRKGAVKENKALSIIPTPAEAQGLAFDRDGNLWLTTSSSKHGGLFKIDPKTGKVVARFEMVIGIEDIGFDSDEKLCSVSEAGSRRWLNWSKTFPVLFQLDVSKLK